MARRRSGLAGGGLAERGLRGGKPRDRHAEGRAGNIIEPELMAEADRGGIPAMLAADAELQRAARFSSALDADAHHLADAFLVDGDERIAGKDSARGINAKEARGVVAADAVG